MPRDYPPEFRARAIALVRAGKSQNQTAHELDIHPVTLSKWVKQDKIDRGEIPGISSSESAELRALDAASTSSVSRDGVAKDLDRGFLGLVVVGLDVGHA